jgi:hypothetical protein
MTVTIPPAVTLASEGFKDSHCDKDVTSRVVASEKRAVATSGKTPAVADGAVTVTDTTVLTTAGGGVGAVGVVGLGAVGLVVWLLLQAVMSAIMAIVHAVLRA